MSFNSNFLFYGTPKDKFKTFYPVEESSLPFTSGKAITTQFSRPAALLKIIGAATLVLAAYMKPTSVATLAGAVITFSPVLHQKIRPEGSSLLPITFACAAVAKVIDHFKLNVVIALAGSIYTLFLAHSQLVNQDPLVVAFHKIVGGKEKFENLPELIFKKQDLKLSEYIKNMNWESFAPVTRATYHGRNLLIIKGATRGKTKEIFSPPEAKTLFVFVEKLNPGELPNKLPAFCETAIDALTKARNSSTTTLTDITDKPAEYNIKMCSEITAEMANEFFAQLHASKD